MIAAQSQLSQILGAAFRRNGPQDVGQVLGAELAGRREMIDVHVYLRRSHFAIDIGAAPRHGHELRAAEVDLGHSAAVVIVNRVDGARDYGYPENGLGLDGLNRSAGLLCRVGYLGGQRSECEKGQTCSFHMFIHEPPAASEHVTYLCMTEYPAGRLAV